MNRVALLVVSGLLLAGCAKGGDANRPASRQGGDTASAGAAAEAPGQPLPADGAIREPAVAGQWYPADANELVREVDKLLSAMVVRVEGKVRGLIVPHAGYRFSGVTAAAAYKQLMGQDVTTAIILAPCHTASFAGASIPAFEGYRTPLGVAQLAPAAAEIVKLKPFVAAPFVKVERPAWSANSPKQAPPDGRETPHTWEHSVEVQLPLIQWTLRDCTIVPVVYGKVDPEVVAMQLAPFIDDKTVLIAATNLSHEHPYDMAKSLDAWCLKSVEEMNIDQMAAQEASGMGGMLTLMRIAKQRGWKPVLLDYRTSADAPYGSRESVEGYMAVAFVEPGAGANAPLTGEEKVFLLTLARKMASAQVQGTAMPKIDRPSLPPSLIRPRGAFVTILKDGRLRRCAGFAAPGKPLYQAVIEGSLNASAADPRYKPIRPDELGQCIFSISVLSNPKPIYYNSPSDLLKSLRPNVDGVVVGIPVRSGKQVSVSTAVYLPVMWNDIPEPEKFMDSLCREAGLPADTWRRSQAKILTFQCEDFVEFAPPAAQQASAPTSSPVSPASSPAN